MQHLDTERIAAFDHDAPSVDELAHLAACRSCRAERLALTGLTQLATRAATVPDTAYGPRMTNWESLSSRLRAEGLIAEVPPVPAGREFGEPPRAQPRITGSRSRADWWQAAAALLLAVGGAGVGRLSAGAPILPLSAESSAVTNDPRAATAFNSLDDANRVLNRAQRDYERASLWLAANDTTVKSSEVVRRRLAALDQMLAASRAGLEEAPQDPVLNHYYLATYSAREATLQQLDGALPVGRSIERF